MKKNIIVTGGSSGLGNFLARKLEKENNNVINLSRKNIKNLKSFQCDLTNEFELELSFKKIKKQYKKIDCIIFCAGKSSFKTKNIQTRWMQSLKDNLLSVVFTIDTFSRFYKMKKLDIIIFSSIAGKKILTDAPIEYSVSKSALNFYGKFISKKFSKNQVRINIISPGNILLKDNNWFWRLKKNKQKTLNYINKNVPTKKFCDPNSIFNLIKIILDKKSNFLGSNITMDGGQSI